MGVIQDIGYKLQLPGLGFSQPYGTPYSQSRTPSAVLGAQTQKNADPLGFNYNPTATQDKTRQTLNNQGLLYQVREGNPTFNITGSQSTNDAGGGGGGGAPINDPNAPQQGWGRTFDNMDAYNRFRDEQSSAIGGAWDSYLGSLDQQMGALSGQRSTLEGIVKNQYQSGYNDISGQRNLGLQDIGRARESVVTEQKKTLNDLASDLRSSFLAGNIYLGSRGAGDSSAADQYSYALQKMGNKNRGDVLSQSRELNADIDARESRLNEITTQEVNKLGTERDSGILQVALWFENAQNSIRDAQAQGKLHKGLDLASLSKDLLNQATSRLQQIEDRFMNQKDTLFSWATSQATNINQLKSNLAQISNIQVPSYSQFGNLGVTTPTVDAQGNIMATGYGYNSEDEKRRQGLI